MYYTMKEETLRGLATQLVEGMPNNRFFELWCGFVDIDDELMEEWDNTDTPVGNMHAIMRKRYFYYLLAHSEGSPVRPPESFTEFLDQYKEVRDELEQWAFGDRTDDIEED